MAMHMGFKSFKIKIGTFVSRPSRKTEECEITNFKIFWGTTWTTTENLEMKVVFTCTC